MLDVPRSTLTVIVPVLLEPGPVKVRVTGPVRVVPFGTAVPLLIVILTVCALESVRVSVNVRISRKWPDAKATQTAATLQ